jgi:hypothetical protein
LLKNPANKNPLGGEGFRMVFPKRHLFLWLCFGLPSNNCSIEHPEGVGFLEFPISQALSLQKII